MDKDRFYREARRDLPGPLAGLRVLELSTTWAAPMCGCLLADMGADVIKVEHPAGEMARRAPPFLPGTPVSFMQAMVNRNKRSLTLDVRDPEGRALFLKLAARSDVVVENFRPGTLERWSLGYADVRAVRADVVYVSISGFGQWGPDHDRVGYDPLAQAASGFLSLNGDPDGLPVKSPTFLSDDLAGVHAALAALAALRHRDATGEGQHLDVSLLDCLLFQSTGFLTLGAVGDPLPRMGNEYRIAAPANVYRARDGYVSAGVVLDSHWKRLCRVMQRPELAEHADYATTAARIGRRQEVNRLLAVWIAGRSVAEVMAAFDAEGIPASPVRTYAEAARDPHVLERDMLQEVPQENGAPAPITGPAVKFSRTPTRVRQGARALGADTAEVLAELGVDAETLARLRESGVS